MSQCVSGGEREESGGGAMWSGGGSHLLTAAPRRKPKQQDPPQTQPNPPALCCRSQNPGAGRSRGRRDGLRGQRWSARALYNSRTRAVPRTAPGPPKYT